MIFDHLNKADLYQLGSRFQTGFNYIREFHPDMKDGRFPIEGDDVYALVQTFDTASPLERQFESHQVYADIHYIVSGGELIYYSQPFELTPKTAYDQERDAIYYHDHDNLGLILRAGYFMVFWPHDAHKPACIDPSEGSRHVRKIVIKVRLT